MNPYLRSAYLIFTAGRFTNSYKFALARSLVRLAATLDANGLSISKRDLAQCFLEYYWLLETRYHVRQGVDPGKDPIVMIQIRKQVKQGVIKQGESLAAFKKRSPGEYGKLLRVVQKGAFDDVIPRFHSVRGKSVTPVLYHFRGQVGNAGDEINLTSDSKAALKEYGQAIDYMAVAGWVKFTECFTTAPRLFQKLSGELPTRQSLTKWKGVLQGIQGGRCFYCENDATGCGEVDHVLPWSFVLEDKTWNLVLACDACNSLKRDRLVDISTLDLLMSRNKSVMDRRVPACGTFARHFDEWRTGDLEKHITALYDQAELDGFPGWQRE